MTLESLIDIAAANQTAHGFDPTFMEFIALTHSELSEAVEDFRDNRKPDEELITDGKPCGIPSELADAVIRICAYCGVHQIDLVSAINRKIVFNTGRPFKHGRTL